jgi:hypothetical protein
LDYDLYVPLWMMITLVVECSIIGNFNQNLADYFREGKDGKDSVQVMAKSFSPSSIWNLFLFISFFFTIAPFGVYLFARIKMLDGETQFLKLFSALGYSYISYVPAIALTLVNIGTMKWALIALAVMNQIICL